MRVLFASSEAVPLAKTGGLADVSAALPRALAELGVDVRIVVPGYPEALERVHGKEEPIGLGDVQGFGQTWLVPARMPDIDLPLWLVDCPARFDRGGGLYFDEQGQAWADNAERFAVFSHVVARIALGTAGVDWTPDVVHVNDWHLGLVPALLATGPRTRPRSVFTIHNLAFQGVFAAETFGRLGLPNEWFTSDGIEYYGSVSFLKAGIRFADHITTVSPRYAREILTPEFGCGLDGLLRTREHDLTGILNGVDYERWTPEDSLVVPHPYNVADLSGKARCKASLQNELGLAPKESAPLVAFVSRLTEQKMADVLPDIVPMLVDEGAQFAICGTGGAAIEAQVRALAASHPQRVAVRVGYEEPLARRVLAGADILAAPARFEPCGLTQMYAMRFGTIPVVRAVGGLADTVIGNPGQANARCATGFHFQQATGRALAGALGQACGAYRQRDDWRAMQMRAMSQDFRWRRPAERYVALYAALARDVGATGDGHRRGKPC
ncbi:MAG: glycogen synthase GlgA [Paraburkholderia sp.]|nr:MAG: glycogen synthase GlgA [Paraburkholderia sp.]